ncbi:MAG TPA: helix-turn-helix domain-containing protein [Stellaceae bacterium]|jgi:DNA-binding transcriptional regulator YiaG|nr:helix-turn-helix domain-containing protein [Stellaceae bacterium]
MLVRLHANAVTTPQMRAYIQTSGRPVAELAHAPGISETTVRRWRQRRKPDTRTDPPLIKSDNSGRRAYEQKDSAIIVLSEWESGRCSDPTGIEHSSGPYRVNDSTEILRG